MAIRYKHRTGTVVSQFIFQQIILMQLDRFAHQVLYDRQGSGTGGIGPVHEFAFHDRGTLLRSSFLSGFIPGQLLCLLYAVVLGFLCDFLRRDNLESSLDGILNERILQLLQFGCTLLFFLSCRHLLGFRLFLRHFLRPYQCAVFPLTESPEQSCR